MDLPFLTDLYEADIDTAKSNGWSIDYTEMYSNGPVMIKEDRFIWRIVPGQWVCADMVSDGLKGIYKNYRHYDTLHDALTGES